MGPKRDSKWTLRRPKWRPESVPIRVPCPDAAWGAKRDDPGSILGSSWGRFWSFLGLVAGFYSEMSISRKSYKKLYNFDNVRAGRAIVLDQNLVPEGVPEHFLGQIPVLETMFELPKHCVCAEEKTSRAHGHGFGTSKSPTLYLEFGSV